MGDGADAQAFDDPAGDRTANNAVRHQYRVLGKAEKALMVQIKDAGAAFIKLLHHIGGTDPVGDHQGSRDPRAGADARTRCVMRAERDAA